LLSTNRDKTDPLLDLDYTNAQQIRAGAGSVVYKCQSTNPCDAVCLKHITTLRHSQITDLREFKILQSFLRYHGRPPSIIELLGYCNDTPSGVIRNVLVLEFCEFSLDDLIRGLRPAVASEMKSTHSYISLHEISAITLSISSALGFLENIGIAHNDVKSSNILWKKSTAMWKLADFGSARNTPFHNKNRKIGTLSNSSPELFMGCKDIGSKSDVWSLGCVLWECVTLIFPFDFNDLHAFQNGYQKSSQFPVHDIIRSLPNSPKSRRIITQNILKYMLEPIISKRWNASQCTELVKIIDKLKDEEHLESYISVRARDI
jgi:serine/threonine protein kinase